MNISVCPIYTLLKDGGDGAPCVAVDTLRMTSVAVTALSRGCARLRVVSTPEEARRLAADTGSLLGGERQAVRIEGFDFSNSPLEYTRERVEGRSLVMTTTNGTNAILAAQRVGSVRLGCLLNAAAVARSLAGEEAVRFVLAGTNGLFSLEDAVTAGAVIERLGGEADALDDMALASLTLYRAAKDDLHGLLGQVAHYRRLRGLGYRDDLDWCLREDVLSCVPRLHGDGWFYAE